MPNKLDMWTFLATVALNDTYAREALLAAGFHPKQITAKAEKAARKGYYDYGVVADRGWLTEKGREFLAD